ncbi:MAG: cyclase family protein [Lacisediminihabitans sp.]
MLTRRLFDVPLEVLSLPSKGRIYDLCSGWWPGMPVAAAHPPFQVQTYRSPQGMRAEKLFPYSTPNDMNYSFISEVVSTTMHAGTHIDALCHVTDGKDDTWYGGHSAKDYLGDAGPLRDDATALPPILTRGVMLDIPAALGVAELAPSQPIGEAELRAACERQNVTLQPGDAVLIRTGFMRDWPDPERMNRAEQPGLTIGGARWLQPQKPVLIGADNTSIEVAPSLVPGEPQPVHRYLIRQCGIPLLEWVYLEDLAADGVSEFLFACAPLPIRGATGSLVRPLAIL